MIGVLGATGTIGGELVRLLAERGHRVLAFTRDPARAPAHPGVAWRALDLAERGGAAPAFEGLDRLFVLTGNTANLVRIEKNALRGAAEAEVAHVVKLSALGASDHSTSVIGLWHHNVERVLRESGLSWTVLRPHHFAQNLLDPEVFDRREGRVYSAAGDGRIPFVDTRDIAAVAAAVLTQPDHRGETLVLTGPEARSYGDAADLLAEVLGRRIDYVRMSDDDAWIRARSFGAAPHLAAARIALAGYQRAGGPTEHTTDTIERITGRPARSLRRFIEDHREVLGGEA